MTPPDELELHPERGLAAWLPSAAFWATFRAISMEEVPTERRADVLTPQGTFFRRDRYTHPVIDAATWRLQLSGFARDGELSLSDLQALPQVDEACVVECAGNGNHWQGSAGLVGQGRFTGPRVTDIIDAAGGPGDATHVVFRGADGKLSAKGYHYGLSLDELRRSDAIVALTFNGAPLTRERGFPARLIAPGIYSMAHVKWLGWIEGLTRPHEGMYNRLVYVNKRRVNGVWRKEEARWIGLKSMISRCVRHQAGWELLGQAWGGAAPIARVTVTVDGGATWRDAELTRAEGHFEGGVRTDRAWATFRYVWADPAPGEHRIACRAYAEDGAEQPMEQPADWQGHFDQVGVKWRRVRVPV